MIDRVVVQQKAAHRGANRKVQHCRPEAALGQGAKPSGGIDAVLHQCHARKDRRAHGGDHIGALKGKPKWPPAFGPSITTISGDLL